MPVRCAALLALLALGCGKDDAHPTAPPGNDHDEEPATARAGRDEPPPADAPAVVFDVSGSPARVTVEVARTSRQIQRGLMYRENLPPDAGMLFLMRTEKVQTFWMKNTLIPLDMIFITGDMKVAGVVANAEPKTTTTRSVDKPSRYVLEVNGGWAAAHGVKAGTRARFEHVKL